MSSTKKAYRLFSEVNIEIPVFSRSWYLDAVCGEDNWEVSLARKGDRIVASLPYFRKDKGPIKRITMPMLTKFMGPFITRDLRFGKHIYQLYSELIDNLPAYDVFEQSFHYQADNWLPLHWKGFRQSNLYSYILEPIQDLEGVYNGFSSDYRNNKIKKAKENVFVKEVNIEEFYTLNAMSFKRQGIQIPYTLDFLQRLNDTLIENNSRKIIAAVDAGGNVHSVAYIIWDKNSAYYLMAGDNPNFRGSGAGILLVWEAIQFAARELYLDRFDFLGSMIPGIERVRRQFGAKPTPYFHLVHTPTFKGKLYYTMKILSGKNIA